MKTRHFLGLCGNEDIQSMPLGAVRDECHIQENHTEAG